MTLVVLEVELQACTRCVEKLRPKRKETNVNDENEWECSVDV